MPHAAKGPTPLVRRAGWSSTNRLIALSIVFDAVLTAVIVAVLLL